MNDLAFFGFFCCLSFLMGMCVGDYASDKNKATWFGLVVLLMVLSIGITIGISSRY